MTPTRYALASLLFLPTLALAQEDAGAALELWSPDAGIEVSVPTDAGTPIPPVAVTVPSPSLKVALGEGVTFKHGDVSLQLRGRMQFQALSVIPGENSNAVRQNAFFIRRARLAIKGEFPFHLSFNMQLAFSPLDMEADAPNVLRDLYGTWAPLRDLSLRFGQMKVPFDVQRVISSSALQFPDRTLVTGEFNLDRDMGVVAFSDDLFGLGHRLRYSLGVFGGDGRNRIGTNVGLLYSARIRYSPFGAFDDKFEGDPDRDPRFRLAFGGGVARNVATNRPRSTTGTPYKAATFNYTHATGDVHAKWYGLSLLGEVYWRQADLGIDGNATPIASITSTVSGASVTEYSRSGWGYFIQGGGYVLPWLELVARFGDTRPLGPTDPAFRRTREIGGGINLMFLKHDLKVQGDVNWIDDGTGNNGRVQLRIQTQIYF